MVEETVQSSLKRKAVELESTSTLQITPTEVNETKSRKLSVDDETIKRKVTSKGEVENYFFYGHCSVQGLRPHFEDAHAYTFHVEEKFDKTKNENVILSFFAVMDGHGGYECAQYCSKNFLQKTFDVWKPESVRDYLKKLRTDRSIETVFLELDKDFYELKKDSGEKISGSTAIVAWVIYDEEAQENNLQIITSNVGDSRCMFFDANDRSVHELSRDHKPHLPEEKERIYAANGFIARNRTNGTLAMSRALGDFKHKQTPGLPLEEQAVSSLPDVHRTEGTTTTTDTHAETTLYSFLLLGCDGLFDVMNSEEVVEYVERQLVKNKQNLNADTLQAITEEMCRHCIQDRGSTDNVSISLVVFL